METVPVHKDNWIPRSPVFTSYQYITPENTVIAADFSWSTKRPTVNLDNYEKIIKVDCSNNEILNLSFDTPESASMAYKSWVDVKNLAFLLGHEHKCNAIESVSFLSAENLQITDESKLIINTRSLTHNDILGDYAMSIRPTSKTRLRKRVDDAPGYILDVNYDRKTKKAKKKKLEIAAMVDKDDNTPGPSLYCKDCFLNGGVSMNFDMNSSNGTISGLNARFKGNFKANMDADLQVPAAKNSSLNWYPISHLELNPIQVPGIFSLGAYVSLIAAFEFDMPQDIQAGLGFDFKYKFHFDLASVSVFEKPRPKFNSKSLMKPHEYKTENFNVMSAHAHLSPSIGLKFTVFNQHILRANIAIENTLGFDVLDPGNGNSCVSQKTNMKLFHQNSADLQLSIPGRNFTTNLFSSDKQPLGCKFCNRCYEKNIVNK